MKPIAGNLLTAIAILAVAGAIGVAITYSALRLTSETPATAQAPKEISAQAAPTQKPADQTVTNGLILYSSKTPQIYEAGFRRIADYYGLALKDADLASQPLTDTLLRDETGAYYHTIFVAGASLDSLLDNTGITLLKSVVDSGANLMIAGLQKQESFNLRALTDGEITGSTSPSDPGMDYHVSSIWPEVTQEFSGVDIVGDKEQTDYALTISSHTPNCQSLVNSTDGMNKTYVVLAICTQGSGHVFVSSATTDGALQYSPISSSYYAMTQADMSIKAQRFAQIVPLMMFLRYSAGDAVWHQNHHYANLTLDDLALKTTQFNYASILQHAIDHNFHMTLAMPPVAYTATEQSVVNLFLQHPDRLSVVQHGNNHTGYEFYNYTADPKNSSDPNKPNPLSEQEANIVEGLTRMEAFQHTTGVPFARAMIFPSNIAPADTLTLLKEYNFQATINSRDYPLGVQRTTTWDSYMYQAELSYKNFAVMDRTGPRTDPYAFSLFIGQPILLYVHKDFFGNNMGAFDPVADHINGLQGKVEWQSLDYILKRLYLERTTHDGTVNVMFYGNDLVVSNETGKANTYHLQRKEEQNVPIAGVSLDGKPVKYQVTSGVLEVDAVIPAGGTRELTITYAPPGRDFAIASSDVTIDAVKGVVVTKVHNKGTQPGPVTVGLFKGTADKGTLLALTTAQRIEAGGAVVLTTALPTLPTGDITIAVDPYNVVQETDETNNIVTKGVQAGNTPAAPASTPASKQVQP